jgi:hypothetical protein
LSSSCQIGLGTFFSALSVTAVSWIMLLVDGLACRIVHMRTAWASRMWAGNLVGTVERRRTRDLSGNVMQYWIRLAIGHPDRVIQEVEWGSGNVVGIGVGEAGDESYLSGDDPL